MLPQASVAVQVRVIVLRLTQVSLETTSAEVTTGAVSQASVAVNVAAVGTSAIQVTVIFAGTPAKTGATRSLTVITCEAVTVRLQASVAVQVRVKV